MSAITDYSAFVVTVIVFLLIPGPGNLALMASTAQGGWRGGVAATLGLILGGAIGNLIDRVRLGYVIDYADFHIGDIRPFLVFNLADAAITIGVLILLARALMLREKAPKSETP